VASGVDEATSKTTNRAAVPAVGNGSREHGADAGRISASRVGRQKASEWNRIHSGTCETDKECANISICDDDNTCFPQGRIIMECVAVFIIIGTGISACICCPCRGLMGC
jgi:hypothetical protein